MKRIILLTMLGVPSDAYWLTPSALRVGFCFWKARVKMGKDTLKKHTVLCECIF